MHTPRHPTRSITIMASALLALFLLSFVLGRYGVPLGEVVKILLSRVFPIEQTWTDNMAIAVWNVRLPRILLACLVGCGLSAAGTAYQTVFQNPMAAPDILGASSGACFGAALAILTGQSTVMVTVFAFLASLLSVALVYLVGRRTRGSRVVSLLLAGIMVGSLFSACTSYIKLVADPTNQLPPDHLLAHGQPLRHPYAHRRLCRRLYGGRADAPAAAPLAHEPADPLAG